MIISIINQKGGTGKTTTTINLGRALAELGERVLLIDMDPQANLTYSLAVHNSELTILSLLRDEVTTEETMVEGEYVDIIPADNSLGQLQADSGNQASNLEEALSSVYHDYDYILIDCPPSISWLTINALTASSKVFIPMQLDVFSIQGLRQIIQTVDDVKAEHNPELEIIGVLAVMVDWRKKLTKEVLNHVKEEFTVKVFDSYVHTNVKAAEAPSFGLSVLDYAPNSSSAKDYRNVARELIQSIKKSKEFESNN